MNVSRKKLSLVIKNVNDLYDMLSKKYYLPAINCRCVTKDYLLELKKEPITIFFMKNEEIKRKHIRNTRLTCMELLEILENLLREKNKNPTGFLPDQPPNKRWLIDAILLLQPDDPYNFLGPDIQEELDYEIEVNSE